MKNKSTFIILLCAVLILISAGFAYNKFSTPKFKDLDPSWGLGTKVTRSVSNNRNYEWYVDQYSTGKNAELNCGPSVMEMAAKWQDENSTLKAEELSEFITNNYMPEGSPYLGIDDYLLYKLLRANKINLSTLNKITEETLTSEIDKGNIVIVLLDMKNIKYNPNPEERVGVPFDFSTETGNVYHFVIVKGYKEVDNKMYFETYDSLSKSQTYKNGELIGKDRYYSSDEFIAVISKLKELTYPITGWNDAIVINETK